MTNQEIIDKLLNGEMKLYQVDKEVSAKEATDIRREFLEDHFNQTILPHVPDTIYNPFKYGVGQLANRMHISYYQ